MKKNFMKICSLVIAVAFTSASFIFAETVQTEDLSFEEPVSSPETAGVKKPVDIDETEFTKISLFDKPLFFILEVQFSSEFMGNYELSGNASDDIVEVEPALNAALLYQLGENISIFLENEIQFKGEFFLETDESRKQWVFERIESWILFSDIAGSRISLQVGRQKYEDERQWWWDAEFDSVRLHYNTEGIHSEIAVAQEIGAESTETDVWGPENKNLLRILSQTTWGDEETSRYAIFGLYQDDHSHRPRAGDLIRPFDEDELDADLFWYGARAMGDIETERMGDFAWWLDMAGIVGKETLFEFEETEDGDSEVAEIVERNVAGWGYDAGIIWETGSFNDMTLSLGYAWGSGDRDPEDDKNRSFRQTGFNEGDQRFQYYGELLNPDLSNLQIITASIGFPIGENGFIDFIYHGYRQDHPADFLWESDLEIDPEGHQKVIGEELDIAFTFEKENHLEIESSTAFFKAGNAFGDLSGNTAYRIKFEINWLF